MRWTELLTYSQLLGVVCSKGGVFRRSLVCPPYVSRQQRDAVKYRRIKTSPSIISSSQRASATLDRDLFVPGEAMPASSAPEDEEGRGERVGHARPNDLYFFFPEAPHVRSSVPKIATRYKSLPNGLGIPVWDPHRQLEPVCGGCPNRPMCRLHVPHRLLRPPLCIFSGESNVPVANTLLLLL